MEAVLEVFKPIVEGYVHLFPTWVIGILLIIGTLRLVVKPAMAIAKSVVASTPSLEDDLLVQKVETSKAYQIAVFLIDWIASIKLPQKK